MRDCSDEDSSESIPTTALDACRRLALHLADLGSPAADSTSHPEKDEADPRFRLVHGPERGAYGRWDGHAGVLIPASDHAGREKLLRYLARAPLSLERMSLACSLRPGAADFSGTSCRRLSGTISN